MPEKTKTIKKTNTPKNILEKVKAEIAQSVVGQSSLIDEIILCVFAGGHCLIRGLPGLAKTTVVKSIAQVFGLDFNRVQFTPDLMPSDLIGYEVLEEARGKKQFRFIEGPIFSQVLLADEINRTPPKTQSALLQAMQEKEVTVMGKAYTMADPFLVLATQNPIEQEGTYPLPEAQLDRFMFLINVDYPSYEEELEIIKMDQINAQKPLKPIFTQAELKKHIASAEKVKVADKVYQWIVKLVQSTRPTSEHAPEIVKANVGYGASPRASLSIVKAAKVFAYLKGDTTLEKHHILRVLKPVLRHRISLNFSGEAELESTDQVIEALAKL